MWGLREPGWKCIRCLVSLALPGGRGNWKLNNFLFIRLVVSAHPGPQGRTRRWVCDALLGALSQPHALFSCLEAGGSPTPPGARTLRGPQHAFLESGRLRFMTEDEALVLLCGWHWHLGTWPLKTPAASRGCWWQVGAPAAGRASLAVVTPACRLMARR